MLAKYNECKKWYRHLSFEEEKTKPSTEVTLSSKLILKTFLTTSNFIQFSPEKFYIGKFI